MTTLHGRRVLITGGAGFIAAALSERLVAENELTLLDLDFGRDKPIHFSSILDNPSVRTIEADIRDATQVRATARDVDVVVHAAAVVGVNNVLRASRETIETNMLGTVNLLKAVQDRAGDLHRFVFFSTSEVFGGSSFRVSESHFASIGSVDEARWSYSISKLAGEHLTFAHLREFGLPAVIVRPFNVFGPGRTGDHAMIRFVAGVLRNEPLIVTGDGSQIRSWCYVDDFVDALVLMLTIPEAIGADFNIGNSRNTLTIFELAKRVKQLAESDVEIIFKDIDYSDIDIRVPATSKARDLLGYEPAVDIDDAILRTLAWYRDHPEALAFID